MIEAIQRLATEHDLVLYDPQGDAIYLPVTPTEGTAAALHPRTERDNH